MIPGVIDNLIAQDGQVTPANLRKLRQALFDLVDKAEELAADIPGYPKNLLGEQSYFPALNWLCPRPPLCY